MHETTEIGHEIEINTFRGDGPVVSSFWDRPVFGRDIRMMYFVPYYPYDDIWYEMLTDLEERANKDDV